MVPTSMGGIEVLFLSVAPVQLSQTPPFVERGLAPGSPTSDPTVARIWIDPTTLLPHWSLSRDATFRMPPHRRVTVWVPRRSDTPCTRTDRRR